MTDRVAVMDWIERHFKTYEKERGFFQSQSEADVGWREIHEEWISRLSTPDLGRLLVARYSSAPLEILSRGDWIPSDHDSDSKALVYIKGAINIPLSILSDAVESRKSSSGLSLFEFQARRLMELSQSNTLSPDPVLVSAIASLPGSKSDDLTALSPAYAGLTTVGLAARFTHDERSIKESAQAQIIIQYGRVVADFVEGQGKRFEIEINLDVEDSKSRKTSFRGFAFADATAGGKFTNVIDIGRHQSLLEAFVDSVLSGPGGANRAIPGRRDVVIFPSQEWLLLRDDRLPAQFHAIKSLIPTRPPIRAAVSFTSPGYKSLPDSLRNITFVKSSMHVNQLIDPEVHFASDFQSRQEHQSTIVITDLHTKKKELGVGYEAPVDLVKSHLGRNTTLALKNSKSTDKALAPDLASNPDYIPSRFSIHTAQSALCLPYLQAVTGWTGNERTFGLLAREVGVAYVVENAVVITPPVQTMLASFAHGSAQHQATCLMLANSILAYEVWNEMWELLKGSGNVHMTTSEVLAIAKGLLWRRARSPTVLTSIVKNLSTDYLVSIARVYYSFLINSH